VTKNNSERIAIVSDTHGFLDSRVANVVSGCTMAVHAGDIGSAEVIHALAKRVNTVIAVRGNNDEPAKWDATGLSVLRDIPEYASVTLPGGVLSVVHGHRVWGYRDRHDRLRQQFPGARVIVYGHSHHQLCDQDSRPWVVNPGAAGRNRTFGGPSCLVLYANHDAWHFKTYRFGALDRKAS